MNAAVTTPDEAGNFDLFRLTKSKRVVDISPNTIRAYSKAGLNIYKRGRAAYVSKAELAAFIRMPKKGVAL